MNDSNTFMAFWATVNNVLKSNDKPELGYGEAKSYWLEFNHKADVETIRAALQSDSVYAVDPWRRNNPIM